MQTKVEISVNALYVKTASFDNMLIDSDTMFENLNIEQ